MDFEVLGEAKVDYTNAYLFLLHPLVSKKKTLQFLLQGDAHKVTKTGDTRRNDLHHISKFYNIAADREIE